MEAMFEAGRLSLIEQTSLEIQQASLEIQRTSLEIQQAILTAQQSGNDIAFWVGITQAAVALLVGLIQAGVVGWGIRYMIRMGERREQQHAERHTETLRALDHQHTEMLEALRLQATSSSEQHAVTMRALEALIERTAPARA